MKRLLFGLLTLLLTVIGFWRGSAQESTREWDAFACPFGNATSYLIECGYVRVPADHDQPDGSTMQLAVALVHSPDPLPDPILFLAGGPGDGAVQRAPLLAVQFSELLKRRDLIILDQRGTGMSLPGLNCPEITRSVFVDAADYATTEELLIACSHELTTTFGNLNVYNTKQNAADAASIPSALGYETANLLGISYGTRLGLTILAEHPEQIRSAVLDSVTPLQVNLYEELAYSFDHAFAAFEESCTTDVMCRSFYSNIRDQYYRVYQRLDAERVGEGKESETITAEVLSHFVLTSLYRSETIAQLPAALNDFEAGDFTVLYEWLDGAVTNGSGMGMAMSVMCSDQGAYTTFERAAAAEAAFHPALSPDFGFFGSGGARLCAAWGIDAPTVGQNIAAQSTVPTLLLTGTLDPVTPPEWATLAAETLPNSTVIELVNTAHATTFTHCGLQTAAVFFDNPNGVVSAACTNPPIGFVLSERVTRPAISGAAAISGVIAILGVGLALTAYARRPFYYSLFASLKAVNIYWIGVSVVFLAIIAFSDATKTFNLDATRMVEAVVPLLIGAQAALMFSPDDEPALEIIAACPRGIAWLLVERWIGIIAAQSLIAVGGMLVSLAIAPDQDALIMLARWIPPAVLLSAVGILITLRFRVAAFGLAITGVVWFIFILFGDLFIPGQIEVFPPLSYIQPFLWGVHPYLQPDDLTRSSYWLNRLTVLALGLALFTLSAFGLRDEERLVLGSKRKA